MRKLLFCLLLSIAFIGNAQSVTDKALKSADNAITQGKNGIATVYGDGKDVVKYLTPKAEKLLDKLATKLETTSDKVWIILVKQQRVLSWCYFLGVLSTIFGWFNFYKAFNRGKNELDDSNEWKTSNSVLASSLFIISCIFTYFSVVHLIPMMTGFMNPEYGAMRSILEFANTLK